MGCIQCQRSLLLAVPQRVFHCLHCSPKPSALGWVQRSDIPFIRSHEVEQNASKFVQLSLTCISCHQAHHPKTQPNRSINLIHLYIPRHYAADLIFSIELTQPAGRHFACLRLTIRIIQNPVSIRSFEWKALPLFWQSLSSEAIIQETVRDFHASPASVYAWVIVLFQWRLCQALATASFK